MPTKGFFQSKIILLALIGLVLQLVAPLLGHTYDPATGDVEESIVELIFGGGDWVNILINVLIIVARWLFTDTKISGFLKPGAGLLTAVVLVTAIAFTTEAKAYNQPVKSEFDTGDSLNLKFDEFTLLSSEPNLPPLPVFLPVARLCTPREYKSADKPEIRWYRRSREATMNYESDTEDSQLRYFEISAFRW